MNIPQHIVKKIEALRENPAVCLKKVIEAWISSGEHNRCKARTLGKLREIISSNTVCEFTVAKKLIENFCEYKPELFSPTNKIEHILHINKQSIDTKVGDDRSTFLEVQTTPKVGVSYQWMTNGKLLCNSSVFSGVTNDILVIRNAHQGIEGKYTCCVSSNKGEKKYSNEICVTVHFSPAKKHLLNVHSKLKEVPSDNWPPICAKKYINVTLSERSLERTDRSDLHTQGEIEYENIFGNFKCGEVILIEGRPGSGKTTLLNKIVKDWTRGTTLRGSEYVFLITFRYLNKRKVKTLNDLLDCYMTNFQSAVTNIEESDGEKTCFVLDGFDEFLFQSTHLILKLLKKTYLPQAMLIVSSRCVTSDTLLKEVVSTRIEVFGFKMEQINEYLANFPFRNSSDSEPGSKLKKSLKLHDAVQHMCELPMHAAMICFLYDMKKEVPNTISNIYKEVTRLLVLRYLKKNDENAELSSLEQLKGNTKSSFENICSLAYTMTVNSEQVHVSKDNEEDPFNLKSLSHDERSINLLNIIPTPQLGGLKNAYSFGHLTLQYFLAAYHIAILSDASQQEKMIERILNLKDNGSTVIPFFCGLTSGNNNILNVINMVKLNTIKSMHCAFESQQQVAYDRVIKNYSGELILSEPLSPFDVSTMTTVINKASIPVTKIALGFYTETNHALLQLKEESLKKLKELKISYPGDDDVVDLSEVITKSKNIKKVTLYLAKIEAESAKIIALSITRSESLKELQLCFKQCLPGVINTILSNLSKCCRDVQFNLEFSNIDQAADEELTEVLPLMANMHIQSLCLRYRNKNMELEYGSAYSALKCSKLWILEISSYDQKGRHDVIKFDKWPIRRTIELTNLSIKGTKFDFTSATAMAEYFSFSNKLINLNLSGSKLGLAICNIAEGFKHLVNLKYLYLSNNDIEDSGCVAIACSMSHLDNLEHIHLDHNKIGSSGIASLCEEIHHLSKLITLNLSNNDINFDSAITLIQELRHCHLLRVLNVTSSSTISGIHVKDLVDENDELAIEKLTDALKTHSQERKLHLGYKTITVSTASTGSIGLYERMLPYLPQQCNLL